MVEGVLIWQTVIFLSIVLGGKRRGWIVGFWVVWTIIQVFALWLSVIQFGTILLAWSISEEVATKRRLEEQRTKRCGQSRIRCAAQAVARQVPSVAGPLPVDSERNC